MSVFTNPPDSASETADAYVDAVLGLLGDRDPFEVLQTTPERVAAAVTGASDEQLRAPEAAGKWSMVEIVQHLADSELIWAYRLRMALAEEDPVICGYNQDAWVSKLRYRDAAVDRSLDQLTLLRKANLDLLTSIDEEDRARAVRHAERGDESVAQMIRLYAGHDLVHLHQLARVRDRIVGSAAPWPAS